MLPGHHWARNFTVEADDIDYLSNLLLEGEKPLSSSQLAQALVERRVEEETAKLEERYKDARIYNPSEEYEIGQKVVFPALDFSTAVITDIRPGDNPEHGEFDVLAVQFEDDQKTREFAASLSTEHKLSTNGSDNGFNLTEISVDDIMVEVGHAIMEKVEDALQQEDSLVVVARKWFPRDLMIEPNDGHLNLAEAVLDINGGGPLKTADILEQIGGLGTSSAIELQTFSLNYVLNQDKRFDEVGPTGEVLWYLQRMEPEEVQNVPDVLRYHKIDHDRSLMSEEALTLEAEIDDELSPLEPQSGLQEANVTVIYPHRRAGTLPLNTRTETLFPTARRTPRVWMTLVDGQDDEEFIGWVIPGERYVYGLGPLYRKYSLPIGGYVKVERTDDPGRVKIHFDAYRARTEWVRLISGRGDQLHFEDSKRAIGADYDDLMILGIDDLAALDDSVKTIRRQHRTLATSIQMIIHGLSRLTPQGTVHAKTIYSAVNVIRRCPPGPILAILEANPDFENVGGHYWKLAE